MMGSLRGLSVALAVVGASAVAANLQPVPVDVRRDDDAIRAGEPGAPPDPDDPEINRDFLEATTDWRDAPPRSLS